MEVLKVIFGFFMGFTMTSLTLIGWYLLDIRNELKKLNENKQ